MITNWFPLIIVVGYNALFVLLSAIIIPRIEEQWRMIVFVILWIFCYILIFITFFYAISIGIIEIQECFYPTNITKV